MANRLPPALFFEMRVPSGERLYRRSGVVVTVLVTNDLDIAVHGPGLVDYARGAFNAGSVSWAMWKRTRLCRTASDMVTARVRDAVVLMRRRRELAAWLSPRGLREACNA